MKRVMAGGFDAQPSPASWCKSTEMPPGPCSDECPVMRAIGLSCTMRR